MTECNGCGACCDPVVMPYSQAFTRLLPRGAIDDRLREWILNELTELPRREGIKRTAYLSQGGRTMVQYDGHGVILYSFYFECKWFDKESRRCTNWENRPSVCRDYPQYDDWPDPAKNLPPTCSFNADIGRPVEPMPEGWKPIQMTKKGRR